MGIDYFGPFLVAVGRRVEKRWGAIFTCLTTRAVHLEVAVSLNTASCILAIRRFIARRGTPLETTSDRGTNFVGASRELDEALQELDHDALMEEFCGPRLKWTFNPPEAPHFGGCWERMVRSVKKILNQCVFPRRPTDEILMSAFAEIELILNSRPLTYVPLEDELAEPITPNLLLLGSSDGSKPPAAYCDNPVAIRSTWRMAQHAADLFWKRWVAEYLPTLTRRTKWFQPVRPLKQISAGRSRRETDGALLEELVALEKERHAMVAKKSGNYHAMMSLVTLMDMLTVEDQIDAREEILRFGHRVLKEKLRSYKDS
ncbi:uncharacterized protein LOC128298163 [Anopheles moucheti]|uniref:uncharacterized protein LOC128298163 n=1 Tax=Anopheles moucheti TaxID=186751 RepID=UPI0022F0A17B|nr:uncharacterized protein LOC128298163 [Anopheles moucheti]